MNLVIDRGNSSFKIALFDKKRLVENFQLKEIDSSFLQKIITEYAPESGIISAVKQVDSDISGFLHENIPSFYELNNQLPLPVKIAYETPETLGVDRIAAAVGATAEKKNSNLLIIDIGTAITIDFVSAEGIYKGGNISPGPQLRLKALHDYTDKLPYVPEKGDIPDFGYDTETAIRSGVVQGITRELDSYIEEYQKKQAVFAFLTGGYSFYFESKLKNSIFADENLVLKGLNKILYFQQQK
jgi:type III pantothenate kinase